MSAQKPTAPESNLPPLTSQGLRDMVLDHVLKEFTLFCPTGLPNEAARLRQLMDSMESLMQNVALACIANRHQLTPLKSFGTTISNDPANDVGAQIYELRYRLLEQIGNEAPYVDRLLTLDEAVSEFGDEFVEAYWGKLGEHSPRNVKSPGDRNIWFTTVRYPVVSMDNDITNSATPKPSP